MMTSSGKSLSVMFSSPASIFTCTSSSAVFAYSRSSFRGPGLVKSLPRSDLPMAESVVSPNVSSTSLFIGSLSVSVVVTSSTALALGVISPSSDR